MKSCLYRPSFNLAACAAIALTVGGSTSARGAILSTLFVEQFEDATIDPALTQNGTPAPVFSNGVVDLQGTNTNGSAQGFYLADISAFNSSDGGAGPQGGGPSTSFIMEARIGADGLPGSDGMGATPSSNDVLFSFNGRYGLRFSTAANWSLFTRAAGGASDVNSGIPNAADRPTAGSHIAIVFTNNGATDTLAYYKDGVLAHSVSGDLNRSNINRAGFGLEVNSGAALSRGFNGTFDAISFSTFTGTFETAAGDQFVLLAVPEPTATLLTVVGFVAVATRLRRRGC
jgi:hypothetical protein